MKFLPFFILFLANLLNAWAKDPDGAWRVAPQDHLDELIANAPVLKTEALCEPILTVRLGNTFVAPNPDGKTWKVLQIYFPQYGGPNTLVMMDLATGKVKVEETDRGFNFHLAPSVIAPDGRLFISILGKSMHQEICIYDPAKNEIQLNAIAMPEDIYGETHPMVLGPDGMIYCAGSGQDKAATVVQIDPRTGKTHSYGSVGPSHAPSGCWAYSLAVDERYAYVASGKVPWHLVALDRQTGKWETLATTAKVDGFIRVARPNDGRGCMARIVGDEKDSSKEAKSYWLVDGKLAPMTQPGEPPPKTIRSLSRQVPLPPRPEISVAAATPDVNGDATLWVRPAPPDAKAPVVDSDSGSAKISQDRKAAEDVADGAAPEIPNDAAMEAEGWKPFRYKVALYPQSIYRLTELPDGRLFGAAGAYEGNFVFDPKTGKSEHLGKIHLSQYATLVHDGKVWMSGYPSAPVYVFDPSKPWTAGKRVSGAQVMEDGSPASNPRRLAYLKESGAHKMYAAVAGGGKLWFGGRWYRTGAAGGLGWYDPRDGSSGGIWEPFSNYQINFMTSADNGKLLVISTHRISDPLLNKSKPEQGALFFLDTATGKLLGERVDPVMHAKGAGPILGVGGARVLGWTENPEEPQTSILYGVDAAARKLVWTKKLPFPFPVQIGSNQKEPWDFRLGPDGKVWSWARDRALFRINPTDGMIEVVGRLDKSGPIAFSGSDVYLGGSESLRRVADVLAH